MTKGRSQNRLFTRPRRIWLWKHGELQHVECKPSPVFKVQKEIPTLLDEGRIFSEDTESTHVSETPGTLSLVLDSIQLGFQDETVLLERVSSPDLVIAKLEILADRFAVPMAKPSWTKQRKKRLGTNRRLVRDGRRQAVPLSAAIFFNASYDITREFSRIEQLRAIHAGVDSYKMRISPRWEIEWLRYIDGSATQFDWIVRDYVGRRVMRIVGLDLTGYWKTSLQKASTTMGGKGKIPIEDLVPDVHERDYASFTPTELMYRREYAKGDAEVTLRLYHATADTLCRIDSRVIRKNGLIPFSAPGAAARMMFAKVAECHPDIESWPKPPVWADQDGADVYLGARAFAAVVGSHVGCRSDDLKSAYPAATSLLPDPVSVSYRRIPPGPFDLERWRGRFGAIRISGVGLDPVYPALRRHEGDRLRYLVGSFREQIVTIPEVVMGVARGALRVDEVHGGTWLDGDPSTSFMRRFMVDVFRIKEEHSKNGRTPMGELAKLLLCSAYGKLIEVQTSEIMLEAAFPVPDVRSLPECRLIISSMIRCALLERGAQLNPEDVWLGSASIEARPRREANEAVFQRRLRRARADEDHPWFGLGALEAYCSTLRDMFGPLPLVPLRDLARSARRYRAGTYFLPLFAAQITGFVAGQLGVRASCVRALCGDTDSVHFIPNSATPGNVRRYFQIMADAGYQAPRLDRPDTLIAETSLGIWADDMPSPSTESYIVRPKRYSHKYWDPEKERWRYKQAVHGFSRFTSPEAEAEKDRDRAAELRQIAAHDVMRRMIAGEDVVSFRQRRAPRKGREAVRTNELVGEFSAKDVFLKNDPVPGTTMGDDGVVRWLDLDVSAELSLLDQAAEE
jgi:hypothetical protein